MSILFIHRSYINSILEYKYMNQKFTCVINDGQFVLIIVTSSFGLATAALGSWPNNL